MKSTATSISRRTTGLTLTEMLVVIAIIVVLAMLGMSLVRRAVASAHSAKCVSNLRQIGAAALAYTSENNGCLPPICQVTYGKAWLAESANLWWPSFLAGSDRSANELVYTTWRCPDVRDEEFQVEGSSGLVYSCYTPLRPIVSFIEPTNPTGGMRMGLIQRPEKVWMFGEGGRPVGPTDSDGKAVRFETVGAIQRYGKSWASSSKPVCRHNGGKLANYVACDGHVETLTPKEIEDIDNGAFGKFNGSKVEY